MIVRWDTSQIRHTLLQFSVATCSNHVQTGTCNICCQRQRYKQPPQSVILSQPVCMQFLLGLEAGRCYKWGTDWMSALQSLRGNELWCVHYNADCKVLGITICIAVHINLQFFFYFFFFLLPNVTYSVILIIISQHDVGTVYVHFMFDRGPL